MTNPSLSWIEKEKWTALLTGAGLVERGRARVAPPQAIEPSGPAATAPSGASRIPPLPPRDWEAPPGPLAERLAALAAWAGELSRADSVFVSDDGGLPVFTPQDDCPYLWVSANLLALLKSARALIDILPEGGLSLSLQGGRRLYFLEAATSEGVFGLGLVSGELLDETKLERLRAGLRLAFASG